MESRLITIAIFAVACVIGVALAALWDWRLPLAAATNALHSPVLFASAIVIAVASCVGWVIVLRARHGPDLSIPATMPKPKDALYDMTRRGDFMTNLDAMIAAHAVAERQLALHAIDVDGFTGINERYGYGAGDAVLHAMAARLVKLVENPVHVTRLGSDEFAVIQPEVGGAKHAQIFADRITSALVQAIPADDRKLAPTVSIGYAIAADGDNSSTLLANAESALRRARNLGGGRTQIFSDRLPRPARAGAAGLPGPVPEEWVDLRFQPQYDLIDRRLVGFEVLAWIEHPDLGQLASADFQPMAEASGTSLAIAAMVAERALAAAAAWPEHVGLALNLSAADLRTSELTDLVIQMAGDAAVSPDRLRIEVAARAGAEGDADDDMVGAQLYALKAWGADLVLDDVGAGLMQLWRHGFDGMKLDVSMVRDPAADAGMAAYVATLVDIAKKLNIAIIAEGVETAEQVQFLVGHGCRHVQGALFSRPRAADELAGIIMRDVKNRTAGSERSEDSAAQAA